MNEEVIAYANGPVAKSVCYPKGMPLEALTDRVNRQDPQLYPLVWAPSAEETFLTGEPNPCPCNAVPEERLHRLFNC